MDPLDAILASMSAKTGNGPTVKATTTTPVDAKASAITKGKRKRDTSDDTGAADAAPATESTADEKDIDTAKPLGGIWNPRAYQQLPSALVADVSNRTSRLAAVTPAMELARQQIVRQLCQRILHASEEMGIDRLPNSTYETWQFTSRLTVAEVDPLIPHAASDYTGLFEELVKAGASRSGAKKKCRELTKESEKQLRRFKQQHTGGTGAEGKRRVRVTREAGVSGEGVAMQVVTYGHTSLKVSVPHYDKLRRLYERKLQRKLTNPQDQRVFEAAVFCVLLRYDSLDGGGFQAALNEECFDALLQHFDCKMECFASPLNSRYSRFCSAFLDTDAAFGSMGSFFEFTPQSGCYEANPPFIPRLIKRMADHMTALLEASNDALMFIIIIPAWKETEGWRLLRSSRFSQQHVLIPQKEHGYCEGKQQIRKTRWRIASFDTSVFFWQNPKAIQRWPVTSSAVDDLRQAFRSKQAEERETLGLRNSGKRVRSIAAS